MDTKICSKCGKLLPIDQFNWRDQNKGTRRSECRQCHTKYMNEKYQEKKDIVQNLKSQSKCAKCGENRPYVLDYHHIDPTKKEEGVARLVSNSSSLDKVYQEIEKCVVLCANCHREFHYLNTLDTTFTIQDYLAE